MEVLSTIFWVFDITQPGIEPQSPEPLVNTLPTRLMGQYLVAISHLLKVVNIYIGEAWTVIDRLLTI